MVLNGARRHAADSHLREMVARRPPALPYGAAAARWRGVAQRAGARACGACAQVREQVRGGAGDKSAWQRALSASAQRPPRV